MQDLIPKKSAFIILFLLASLVGGFYYVTIDSRSRIVQIIDVHMPLLERSAINVRLLETTSLKLSKALVDRDDEMIEEYLIDREALEQNLSQMIRLISNVDEIAIESSNTEYSHIKNLEDSIIGLYRQRKFSEAKEQLASSDFNMLREIYVDRIQKAIEDAASLRQKYLVEIDRNLLIFLILATILIVIIGVYFTRLVVSYNKNLNQKLKGEKLLEEARAKSINSARLASLGEMAGGIAHEINNPVAIIQGYAELLKDLCEEKDEVPGPAVLTFANKINATTKRISEIIKGMRSFSRDASNDSFKAINIHDVIEETLSLCKERFRHWKVELKIESDRKEAFIFCRQVEISQVILNLLNNALDAVQNQPEKWVGLKVTRTGELIELSVSDSGPGVTPEIESKIMEPFFTTKEVGKGTGLGLSISKGIALKHGGQLTFDNGGAATNFVLSLPMATEEQIADLLVESRSKND